MKSKLLTFTAFSLAALAGSATADDKAPILSAEEILSRALTYTVKIKINQEIGLNADSGGAGHATAFLINRDRGWLLTNAHVATRSPVRLTVSFKGGDDIPAQRVFVDRLFDLAIVSIPTDRMPEQATAADLECQKLPAIGTPVAIFGHPWGLSYTATRGIISGVPWYFPVEHLQSDATVNAGNSGGPLINLNNGRVVGVASSSVKVGDERNSTAMAFSVPISHACRIIDILQEGGNPNLKQLHIAFATAEDDFRPAVARTYSPDIPLRTGDIIAGVNGSGDVRNTSDLATRLRGTKGPVTLTVQREGQIIDVVAEPYGLEDVLKVRSINLSGLIISMPWRLDYQEHYPHPHFIVDFIKQGTSGSTTGIKPGNLILAVDDKVFADTQSLYNYLEKIDSGRKVKFTLRRWSDDSSFYIEYFHVAVEKRELEWITVEPDAERVAGTQE